MATDLTRLNEQQRNAVLESIDSNVVLLAAAGSGKTATIVKRTEYLIDDLNVKPENIMMITFTNKAAKEIVERVANITSDAYKMWIGTFHSICVRILRKYGHYMGINYFSIIDDKESKNILKQIFKYSETPSAICKDHIICLFKFGNHLKILLHKTVFKLSDCLIDQLFHIQIDRRKFNITRTGF